MIENNPKVFQISVYQGLKLLLFLEKEVQHDDLKQFFKANKMAGFLQNVSSI
jgi:hypothetical protein